MIRYKRLSLNNKKQPRWLPIKTKRNKKLEKTHLYCYSLGIYVQRQIISKLFSESRDLIVIDLDSNTFEIFKLNTLNNLKLAIKHFLGLNIPLDIKECFKSNILIIYCHIKYHSKIKNLIKDRFYPKVNFTNKKHNINSSN